MRKIILHKEDPDTIPFSKVNQSNPIFAKQNGELRGLVVQEDDRWILRLGGSRGATGYHPSLRECLERASDCDFEFFIE